MKLFYTPTSPYARIARIAVLEAGLGRDVELVLARNRRPDNPLLAYSPVARVPTLVDGDLVVVETRHILAYLDELTGEDRFFPIERLGDWGYRRLEGTACGLLDGLAVWGREFMRPEEIRWSFWIDTEVQRAKRCLPWLDQAVESLGADSICFAGLTLGVALDVLDGLAPDADWRSDAPALADWHAAETDRTSYRATRADAAA